ncbi:MAG: cell division protein ZapA [Hydrogenophaga sp.]|uniref:cell division protein ZapA n=1 Tax=Hydrogenophaga sp. TaxID=1904254 RepID=UPI001BC0ED46|nr:cell division protein ZapA [Hydrogenophaga sp.]MBS3911420.1 cell division protein ZapA [Hydrogenophaga sp.]MDO9146622.1 cell division protein ZapA [Hydrogenophaga sp.]MDO9606026.1 cell division protein ZapA [Hydrogenophaga sp.]
MNKPASKQIEVQIMGQSYLLACPVGGESALLDAVERVDTAMCRIRDAGKVKARDRIAVLASLNLAFELSQKEAASAQAPAATPSNGTTINGSSNEASPHTQTRLDDLMRRLDQTLGSDGQLI